MSRTYWKEKINRIDEFEQFFSNYLEEEIVKSIQYISLRKKNYGGHMILIGITNMDFKERIETYAPRILKEIREYQETKETDDDYENSRLPKKLEIFEFNLEKKKEKDKQKKLDKQKKDEWYANPKDFLEKTDLQNQYIPKEKKIIYNGLIIPIDHSDIIHKNTSAHCRIFMGEFDFETTDKKGNIYRFLEENGKYYKFKKDYKDNLEIRLSGKIGECLLWQKSCQNIEITKATYEKHRKASND
jgi:hypothetical protein